MRRNDSDEDQAAGIGMRVAYVDLAVNRDLARPTETEADIRALRRPLAQTTAAPANVADMRANA